MYTQHNTTVFKVYCVILTNDVTSPLGWTSVTSRRVLACLCNREQRVTGAIVFAFVGTSAFLSAVLKVLACVYVCAS